MSSLVLREYPPHGFPVGSSVEALSGHTPVEVVEGGDPVTLTGEGFKAAISMFS
jgi:hypothetical protein